MKIIQKIRQQRADRAARKKEEREAWFDFQKAAWEEENKKMEQEKYDQDLDRRIKLKTLVMSS